MPSIPQILKARHRRRKKNDRTFMRRSGLGCAIVISISFTFCLIISTVVYAYMSRGLPSTATIPLLLEPPDGLLLQPTRFFDRSGQHIILELDNPAIEERTYLSFSDLSSQTDESTPIDLIAATISYIDPTFWNHPGITTIALKSNGNRTIAQRLVSALLLWDEPSSLQRTVREHLLAVQITHQYGREKVLEWYINSAYYGNRVYGAASAADVYFGKSIDKLSLKEAAILAAVADTPSINPFDTPEDARQRGKTVIDALLDQGLITSREATKAHDARPIFQEQIPAPETISAPFMNLVWEQLSPIIPIQRLEQGGFEITTTLDFDLQEQATCAANIHLAQIKGTDSDFENCDASRLIPTLALTEAGTNDDLQVNIIILDPRSGQILTMVGETTPGLDPAHFPGHAPGSLLSPYVYLTAFTRGFNPASLLWDIPSSFAENFNPTTNLDDKFHGPIRLRQALANDYLIPTLATMNQIGGENVWRTIEQFGISIPASSSISLNPECPDCQYLLDGGQVTLLEMTQAYGILANQGDFIGEINADQDNYQLDSITIQRISDIHGGVWLDRQSQEIQSVISSQLAYLINHILSDESARWESFGHPNPLEIGRPAATKIGRTSSGNDSWTVGYTPQMVVGVWLGREKTDDLARGELDSKVSSALWHAIIQYALRELPSEAWLAPPGISTMTVCDPSGMLPSKDCPVVVSEVFLSGHEPTQVDTLYRTYEINRETGRLATVFTPPELIDQQTYLFVPPEASQWAEQIGLESPPETYDVIYTPNPSPEAQITYPKLFTNIKGEITLQGHAFGDDFISYRLQIGQGLNPQNWLTISEDIQEPVIDGDLSTWDTSGLDGLYAVQLLVLRSNQNVDTHTIQVTIDNRPPDVNISYPEDGQTFVHQAGIPITFQIQASDNLGIEHIEYYIDESRIEIQSQPPFAFPWLPRTGKHTLTIKAFDLAGNETSESVTFSVDRQN